MGLNPQRAKGEKHSLASSRYFERAHSAGERVWGVCDVQRGGCHRFRGRRNIAPHATIHIRGCMNNSHHCFSCLSSARPSVLLLGFPDLILALCFACRRAAMPASTPWGFTLMFLTCGAPEPVRGTVWSCETFFSYFVSSCGSTQRLAQGLRIDAAGCTGTLTELTLFRKATATSRKLGGRVSNCDDFLPYVYLGEVHATCG